MHASSLPRFAPDRQGTHTGRRDHQLRRPNASEAQEAAARQAADAKVQELLAEIERLKAVAD